MGQSLEWIRRLGKGFDQPSDLGHNLIRLSIVVVAQDKTVRNVGVPDGTIARGIERLQRLERIVRVVEVDASCVDLHPDMTALHEPKSGEIEDQRIATTMQGLGYHDTAELARIRRPPDNDAGLIGGRASGAGDPIFLRDVIEIRQIVARRQTRPDSGKHRSQHRVWIGDRTRNRGKRRNSGFGKG
jgi:hypothetical protein